MFPDWEAAFDNLWALLKPGGRCVIVDVYAASPGLQGRLVQLTARADLTRKTWAPLQACATDFERRTLETRWEHGGELFLATGVVGSVGLGATTAGPGALPMS